MKIFQSSLICLSLSIVLIGCSKDSSNCLFVGGLWCYPASGTVCIEFRENGEHYIAGAHASNWKAKDDCKTIELYAYTIGAKLYEYKVVSITGNTKGSKMILEEAGGNQTYIKK